MNDKRYRFTVALIIFALCALSVHAQSGRRKTKAPPAAPIPSPTPEPTPSPKNDKTPELIFLVGADRNTGPMSIPLLYHSTAQRACADRLRSRSTAAVDIAQRDLGRGEAIKKAKESSNTYVILLTLNLDEVASTYDDLQLEFVVFTPGTAKVLISGRNFVNGSRTGPVVVGPTTRLPASVFREQWVRQAAEDVADRILKKMNLGAPPPR